MAYRLIYSDFWTDPKIVEEMTPEDRLFYLYILTNPCTTMCGVYQITKKQMAFELGYSPESINSLMERFINHHKLIKYDSTTRELAIKNWGKYNLNNGGKPIIDCLTKELESIKNKELLAYVCENIQTIKIKTLFETFIGNKDIERDVPRRVLRKVSRKDGNTNTIANTIANTKTKANTITNTTTINVSEVVSHFEKCNFILSPILIEKILDDVKTFSLMEVFKAAEIADEQSKHTYNYFRGILERRRAQGDANRDNKSNKESSTGANLNFSCFK